MSNPFKKITTNANKSKKKWKEDREVSSTIVRKCEGCGAARPRDTNLTTCDYCGFKFMDIHSTIKTDK